MPNWRLIIAQNALATERAVVDYTDVKMLHLRIEITLIPSRLDTEHPILNLKVRN